MILDIYNIVCQVALMACFVVYGDWIMVVYGMVCTIALLRR